MVQCIIVYIHNVHITEKNRNLNVCTLHSNNYFKIEKNILNQLDDICKKFIKLVNYDKLTKEKTKTIKTYGTVLQEKIQLLEIDLRNLDQKIEKLYMDRLEDVISLDTYQKISPKLELKKENLLTVIDEMKETLRTYEEDNSLEKILETKNIVKEYMKTRKELNRDLILKLVDRIEIHEDGTIDLHLKLKPLEQIM